MKIALTGYGKMGKEVEKMAVARNHEIILTIDNPEEWEAKSTLLAQADVAIEFSTPDSAVKNMIKCFKQGIPIVCGTTGWNDKLDYVSEQCKLLNGTLLYGSNFSIGVNIFFEINKLLAKLMNNQHEYGVNIEEIHHVNKLDAPSGTAISLANDIISNLDRKSSWTNMEANNYNELEITSIRTDHVPGIHIVNYHSAADTIEIKHSANNRSGLALGALIAAEWIKGKKGVFTFHEILQL